MPQEKREHKRYFREVHQRARHVNGIASPEVARHFDYSFRRAKATILRLGKKGPHEFEDVKAARRFLDAIKHHLPGARAEYGREIAVATRLTRRMGTSAVERMLLNIDHHATQLHGAVNAQLESKGFDPIDHSTAIPVYVTPPVDIAHRARQAIAFLRHPARHREEVVRYGKGQIAVELLGFIKSKK